MVYKNEGDGWLSWPFDKPLYLILNVAVGGAWGAVMGVDDNSLPYRMEVDYVRYYGPEGALN
jgi:beta-glucanase (GH16 family)